MKRYRITELLGTIESPREIYDISEAARIRTLKSERPSLIALTFGTDAYFMAELTPLGISYLEHLRNLAIV